MIGLIQGQVIQLSAPMVCIMTTAGVGYEIELPVPDFCQLQQGSEVTIWTHLHVREDAQLLYGFQKQQDRDVFRQLIKINGVGAKMALAMLSNLSVVELKNSIEQENEGVLVRIPGIGKKTAQRLLIELKDKLKNIDIADSIQVDSNAGEANSASELAIVAETKLALIGLGYKEKEADQAVNQANKKAQTNGDVFVNTQSLLKASLQQLSK